MRAIEAVPNSWSRAGLLPSRSRPNEAIRLGLSPPIRDSGDLAGAEPITLIGPQEVSI